MRMDEQEESRNVEDVRGSGGFGFRPVHGIGLGTLVVILIGSWALGLNPLRVLSFLEGDSTSLAPPEPVSAPPPGAAASDPQVHFVSQILRSTEQVWGDAFAQAGRTYEQPKLRLFRDSYPTACGQGSAASGPFYCPDDRRIYLDLAFFDLMTRQLHAPGDFAHAYVVAHEVGHHVQNLLGILAQQGSQGPFASEAGSNGRSVRIELQADCLAGVWANLSQHERGWRLEPGDIEAALNAAAQVGDDTLQRRSRGTVVPETFTHGTSAQRVFWFQHGFSTGSISACDTFAARRL